MSKIKNKGLKFLAGGAAAVFMFKALDCRINVTHYRIKTGKISGNIRLALITDLHCRKRQDPHTALFNLIKEHSPDTILFGGDIVEGEVAPLTEIVFLRALAEKYPCFYVSGNHEYHTGSLSRTKKLLTDHGITVLDGKWHVHSTGDDSINICGVDDADIGTAGYTSQLEAASPADDTLFSVLLAHKPEYTDLYAKYNFDLILSGHTHGGQWRLPNLIDGVYAPGQGFFPKYPGGEYTVGNKKLIISRGISSMSTMIPRVFNPPELVIIDICSL